MNLITQYENAKKKLLNNAYNDEWGITLTKKEYEEDERNKDKWLPQWFAYDEVLKFIEVTEKAFNLNSRSMTYRKLRKEFDKKVKKLQNNCPHKNKEWAILSSKHNAFKWAPYEALICENCNKQLKKRKRKDDLK